MPGNKVNIKLIIEGCRKNNLNSQRILFEYFMGYAMSICLRYSTNKTQAEEILNDGFLKIFKNIDQYDHAFPFKAWLRKIMINTAIDYSRLSKNKVKYIELHESNTIVDDSELMPVVGLQEDILPILQKLSPAYRMVFNLHVMEGYKHDEIAEMLGIKSSTSRSSFVRAKQKLRKLILQKRKENPLLTKGKYKA